MADEVQDDKQFMLVAEDPHSKRMLEIANKASKSNATVLITGETGVGKELLAQYIHQNSACSHGPFISINCAALPGSMIEAILFGYEKGAFTNAISQYSGKFEQANNGTLMLDEVSEIPIELQAKLLRVLQEREIERLGGRKVVKVQVRIIAATNRNLEQQVAAGYFRNDLYYRLNVIHLNCAPLRARPLDILPLTRYFIEKHSAELHREPPSLTNAAQNKLLHYSWPGNVREMDNVIQRALVMTNEEKLDSFDIEIDESLDIANKDENEKYLNKLNSKLKINEAKAILDTLKETQGSRGMAAQKLNMSPRTLRYKISKLKAIGLKVP